MFTVSMTRIKTRTGEFWVDGNNILHALMFKDVIVDYEDAVDNFLVIKNLTTNQSTLRLLDLTNNPSFENKAKKFLQNKEVQTLAKARAILVTNRVKMVSLNFFVRFNSTSIPTKFFTNYDEAIQWLKLFI